MASESDEEGDLNARFSCMEQPPLIKQLRRILSEYPDNGQIIKELLQNAEDAKAYKVEIIYDERSINQEVIKKKQYRRFFKGPALCIKNNSLFEDKDWRGIKMIASSVKEDDKLKVGRFGLGFKSVFHMTDYPCIMSGDRILLVDPTMPSDQVNAEMKLARLKRYKGMDVDAFFTAFSDLLGINENIMEKGHYQGTVFWFPLRDKVSPISSTLYDREKIMDLFTSFEHDSSETLLFLRHLESVSLHIKSSNGQLTQVAGAEIVDNRLDVRERRIEFTKSIHETSYPNHNPITCSYNMTVKVTNRRGSSEETEWVIVHIFMGNNSTQLLQDLFKNPDLGYSPLVGVAMPITRQTRACFQGHVFCFLPLPREGSRLTGLPVHVNGFFSLSQNRHHLKWSTDDQTGQKVKDVAILWNQTLIKECIPQAYKTLFNRLIEKSKQSGNTQDAVKVIHEAVPDEQYVLDKWKTIPIQLTPYLNELPFLYSNSCNKFVTMKTALFATFSSLHPSVNDCIQDIIDVVSLMKVGYVASNKETFLKLGFYNGGILNDLNPATLASMLRKDIQIIGKLNKSKKYSVLAYLLSGNDYDACLNDLPLLPVASGDWVTFGSGEHVFLGKKEKAVLFPRFQNTLVYRKDEHTDFIWKHLKEMAREEFCQIRPLDKASFSNLLIQTLQLEIGDSYLIESQSQLEWLEKVWHVIDNVDEMKEIHLFPQIKVGTWQHIREIQLHPFTKLFLEKTDIPDVVCECFRLLGAVIIADLPSWFPEDLVSSYLYSGNQTSVDRLLKNLWKMSDRGDNVDTFNTKASIDQRDQFAKYLNELKVLDDVSLSLIQSINIFPVGSTPSVTDRYASINEYTRFVTTTDIPVKLPGTFILAKQDSMQLLSCLGAREEMRDSLVRAILGNMQDGLTYDQSECDRFMMYFLEHMWEFEHQLQNLAGEVHFVKTNTGCLKSPKDLFCPEDDLLQRFFSDQDEKFPVEFWQMNSRCKSALKKLGLKDIDSVNAQDIAESADCIHILNHDLIKYNTCVAKSKATMTILNRKPILLQQWYRNQTLLNYLQQLKFVACAQGKPKHIPSSLPWFSETFCRPSEARDRNYENECLVGATIPLVEQIFSEISSKFNWNCSPPLDKVIHQLQIIKQHYTMKEKSNLVPLVKKIYEFMSQSGFYEDLSMINAEGLIWTGEIFEQSSNVVISLNTNDLQDLTPYLFSVSEEFKVFEPLFKRVGCNPVQSVHVLILALKKIEKKHQNTQSTDDFERDCRIVKRIVEKLAERRNELTEIVMLPILTDCYNQLKFCPAHKCTVDKNASKYEHEEGDNTIIFVSDIVSLDAAKALGAKPLSKQILSGTESMGIEGFGQSEKLTDRIHKLISESYIDGLSVPKELIQNADDAGATEVKFLYDERQHDDARNLLLSKEMADCQGPSLVVYNNALFTESDFSNIRKLNGATKEMDENKIGRFGLGFCAVYNLTDVPSFISKSNLVMFDPQKTYLTEALEDNSPGIRINFKKIENRKLLRLHRDQFQPFQDLFSCDVNKLPETGFNGTLFRFPLRTPAQAENSEISNLSYNREEVQELLSMFIKNAGNMLLFTQNVEHIELYHVPRHSLSATNPVLLFTATRAKIHAVPPFISHKEDMTVLQRVTSALNTGQHFRDIAHYQIKLQVADTSRFFLSKVKQGGETVETNWYVVWEAGQKESLQMSKQIKGKRAVPLSAVAVECNRQFSVPLNETERSSWFYPTGHIFCFLPLPIQTSLPFHLHASFDVTSDRRRLVTLTDDDKDSRQDKWNEYLMSDASVNALFTLLQHFSSTSQKQPYCFYKLWPSDETHSTVTPFHESFYRRIIDEEKCLFFGQNCWAAFSQIVMLETKIREHPEIGDIGFHMLTNIGYKQGKVLVDLPSHIVKCISRYHNIASSFITESEFLEIFLNNIDNIYWNKRTKERNILITYALKSNDIGLKNRMKEKKCIPVKPNGTLKKPCDTVDQNGNLTKLFSEEDEVFVHSDLQNREVIEELYGIGMNYDQLSYEILVDRFSTIEQLAEKCTRCALNRCRLLLQYLSNEQVRENLKGQQNLKESIAKMYTLPVMQKPENWKFSWNADNDNGIKTFEHTSFCVDHERDGTLKLTLAKSPCLFRKYLYKISGLITSVVDEDLLNSNFSNQSATYKILGVKTCVPTSLVVQNMILLSDEFVIGDEHYLELQDIYEHAYKHLQEQINSTKSEKQLELQKELEKLKQKPVILIGKKLFDPMKVAFTVEQECSPYLVKLPDVYDPRFKDLFINIGVREKFTADTILEVLQMKKCEWKDKECKEIDLIIKLLQNLVQCYGSAITERRDDIVAPDIHGVLHPVHELVIADDEFETDVVMHIVHKLVPPQLAEILGAEHKQRKCLEEISFGIPFGQKEKLVSRLNNLLNAYPCDSSIMKELLQNADDAEATEIHFIKDYRNHSTDRIFGPSCESLQGPSLCVYNDSYFTEQDLQGIHDLGEGSKRQDPTKTGQYGVGFNSVYHLTDTPSFLTSGPDDVSDDGLLVIFDPTCKHIPGIKEDEPGIRCDVSKLQANFPGVLQGFAMRDKLFQGNKGTLFRFPLRITESEIRGKLNSNNSIDLIDTIFQEMSLDMFESLLFVKNVKCIRISNITSGELQEEYCVGTEISEGDRLMRSKFSNEIKSICKEVKDDKSKLLLAEKKEICYQMKIVDSSGRDETYVIVQRFGFDDPEEVPSDVQEAYRKKILGCLPIGGVAYRISTGGTNVSTLVSKYGLQDKGEPHITRDTFHAPAMKSKVFCFLPIPGYTMLPVHINGHFSLNESRRDLNEDGYKKKWNECVLKHVVVPAYIQCIYFCRKTFSGKVESMNKWYSLHDLSHKYHKIFPLLKDEFHVYCRYLIKHLYENIITKKHPIFPVFKVEKELNLESNPNENNDKALTFSCEWVSLGFANDAVNGHFDTLTWLTVSDKESIEKCRMLSSLLKDIGMRIIQTPYAIRKVIEKCEVGKPACTDPVDVVQFISTCREVDGPCVLGLSGRNLEETKIKTVERLRILLAYIQSDPSFMITIQYLPILLTNNNVLRVFAKEHPVYLSQFCWMFPEDKERFVHQDLVHVYPYEMLHEEKYVTEFSVNAFMELIPDKFRYRLYNTEPVVCWDKSSEDFPKENWIFSFWKYIHRIEAKSDGFEKASAQFSAWAFIPAVRRNETKLVQISKAFLLVDKGTFHDNESLMMAIEKLNLLLLDEKVFSEWHLYDKFSVKSLVTQINKPDTLLECLHFQANLGKFGFRKTDLEDAVCILKYFSNSLQSKDFTEYALVKEKLLSLPLYITLNDTCVSLNSGKSVSVVPHGMPTDGLENISSSMKIDFLKKNNSLDDLYKFLGLSDIEVSQLYADFVLPSISVLPKQFWLLHITYVKDHVVSTGYRNEVDHSHEKIVKYLKRTAFIETTDGYKRCSDFFDHNNNLFQVLCDQNEFLPERFRDEGWMSFLKRLGLQHKVTDDLLIKFARRIESQKALDVSTITKSEELAEYFISNIHDCKPQTLQAMARICFVLPCCLNKTYTDIFPAKTDGKQFICMEGAVEPKHNHLCWSMLHVLPFSLPEKYHHDLGIHTNPPLVDVLKHFQNISTDLTEDVLRRCRADLRNLMHTMYSFLQKQVVDQKVKDMLLPFPIIHLPSEAKMVKVTDVVLDIDTLYTVKGYLFKAPVEYGQFFDLFESLGTSKNVRCYHYQTVLNQVMMEVGGEEVSVSELRTFKQTLECMYYSLRRSKYCSLPGNEFTNRGLYLLSDNQVMCHSKDLVVIDNDSIKDRIGEVKDIQYFIGFANLQLLGLDPKQFVEMLPETLRPKLLTNIVQEEFDRENMDMVTYSRVASKLTRFINSEEFVTGLCRIVKKSVDLAESKKQSLDMTIDVEKIKRSILQINLVEVSRLETYILYKNEVVNRSHRPRTCFFEKKTENNIPTTNFYFTFSGGYSVLKLIDLINRPGGLAHAIRKHIHIRYDEANMLAFIMTKLDNPQEISRELNDYKFPTLDVNIGLNACSAFPMPGTYVEDKFHPFLVNDLELFDESEYMDVALEIEDLELDEDAQDSADGPVYKYIHIIKEISSATDNPSLVNTKYFVDIGEDENIEVPGYRIFKFVRPQSQTNEVTPHTGTSPQPFLPFDVNCRRIRSLLQEAWALPDQERRRIFRRLLFKWHPDKNRGSEEYAAKVFNFIKHSIQQLERFGRFSDDDKTDGVSSQSSDFSDSHFNMMYENINRRARSYARAYYDNIHQYNRSRQTGNYSHQNAARDEVKHIGEARRWMKQAKGDFSAAKVFFEEAEDQKAFNWICYMCHQASEKALKAGCYAKDANAVSLQDHSLQQPARNLSPSLTTLAVQLENHLGHHTRMRYPNAGDHPEVPKEVFTQSDAQVAIDIARQIIEKADDVLH